MRHLGTKDPRIVLGGIKGRKNLASFITYGGKTRSIKEWAKEFGVTHKHLLNMIRRHGLDFAMEYRKSGTSPPREQTHPHSYAKTRRSRKELRAARLARETLQEQLERERAARLNSLLTASWGGYHESQKENMQ